MNVRFAAAVVLSCMSFVGLQPTEVSGREVSPDAVRPAMRRAAAYLLSKQQADGSWRSEVYGTLKDGSLTPVVCLALVDTRLPGTQRGCQRGLDFVSNRVTGEKEGLVSFAYPLYVAAQTLRLAASQDDFAEAAALEQVLAQYLRQMQLTESLGWSAEDSYYGGWGYAKWPPRKPAAGLPFSPLHVPNLSATTEALAGLSCLGELQDDPQTRKALSFLARVQNLPGQDTNRSRFDDGGFFFIPDDQVRNKAGLAGMDDRGCRRFQSYGSATADGLWSLLLCGLPATDARVECAVGWLGRQYAGASHPGIYATDREYARQAVLYYYLLALAEALSMRGTDRLPTEQEGVDWRTAIGQILLTRQQADGSWRNEAVDVREDDPLIATAFALRTLVLCQMPPATGQIDSSPLDGPAD